MDGEIIRVYEYTHTSCDTKHQVLTPNLVTAELDKDLGTEVTSYLATPIGVLKCGEYEREKLVKLGYFFCNRIGWMKKVKE